MWIFLTHHLTLYSKEPKDAFLKRLDDHAQSSRSLNFFTATIQDYGVTLKSRQGRIRVKQKFGKGNFVLTVMVSEADDGCIVHAVVKPSLGNIIVNGLLLLFVFVCPFPLEIKVAFAGLMFILQLIALGFTACWTKDLFEKKLLTTIRLAKDRSL